MEAVISDQTNQGIKLGHEQKNKVQWAIRGEKWHHFHLKMSWANGCPHSPPTLGIVPSTLKPVPQTLHGIAIYADQLGWFGGSMGRQSVLAVPLVVSVS